MHALFFRVCGVWFACAILASACQTSKQQVAEARAPLILFQLLDRDTGTVEAFAARDQAGSAWSLGPNGASDARRPLQDSSETSLLASPDQRWVALVHNAGNSLRVVEAESGAMSALPEVHELSGEVHSWSPDGTCLLYSTSLETGNVYFLAWAESGRIETFLAPDRFAILDPLVWSPDSRWLAYFSRSEQGSELHVLDPQSGDERLIARSAHPCQPPDSEAMTAGLVWAHDGTRLAYSTFNAEGETLELHTVAVNGSDDRLLNEIPLTAFFGSAAVAQEWLADPRREIFDEAARRCAWSPTHDRLAFDGQEGVFSAGSGRDPILLVAREPNGKAPPVYRWSSDGQWISAKQFFADSSTGADTMLRVVRADGSQSVLIAHDTWGWLVTEWSPVGARLAYASVGDPFEFQVVDLMHGRVARSGIRLTGAGDALRLAFSASGEWLVFAMGGLENVARSDGSEAFTVASRNDDSLVLIDWLTGTDRLLVARSDAIITTSPDNRDERAVWRADTPSTVVASVQIVR